jgi:hypothetical protein
MTDAYVVEVFGHTAGIVVRDSMAETFYFFAATQAFSSLEGRQFREPHAAEHAARQMLAQPKRPLRRENKE